MGKVTVKLRDPVFPTHVGVNRSRAAFTR